MNNNIIMANSGESLSVSRKIPKARLRWVFIVSTERLSCSAISALLFPSIPNNKTSLQRFGNVSIALKSAMYNSSIEECDSEGNVSFIVCSSM